MNAPVFLLLMAALPVDDQSSGLSLYPTTEAVMQGVVAAQPSWQSCQDQFGFSEQWNGSASFSWNPDGSIRNAQLKVDDHSEFVRCWEEALQSVVLTAHHEDAVTCSFVFGVYANRVVLPVQVVLEEIKRKPWFLFVSPRAEEADRLMLMEAWGMLRGAPIEE